MVPPQHMDGKSFLPLILNRPKNIKEKWPDTFLIESSGRRETPEQMAEIRARNAALRLAAKMNETENGTVTDDDEDPNESESSKIASLSDLLKKDMTLYFGSHEDDDDDDGKIIFFLRFFNFKIFPQIKD